MKLAKKIVLPAFVAASETFDLKDCPENGLRCTRDYNPVCGDDGMTYGNKCMARFFFCNRRQGLTQVAYEGECADEPEPCETPCTREYDPVCGSDGNTYANDCILKNANCYATEEILKTRQGPCSIKPPTTKMVPNVSDCPLKCNNGVKVCGSDGLTYNSMCHLKKANCASNKLITRSHKGKCEKKMADDFIPTQDCPLFCHRMLAPVCGNDYTTYGNECSLKRTSCSDKSRNLSKMHEGSCECPESCKKEKNPVCGSDWKTYSSPCELKHASCESGELISIRSFGNCNKATLIEEVEVNLKNGKNVRLKNGRKNKGKKSCNCPNNFKQVCGHNGKTYSNECRAECDGAEIVQNCSCREGPCPNGLQEVLNDFGMNFEVEEESEETEIQDCDNNIPEGECRAACPRIFQYTCTFSSETGYKAFANECERDFFSCSNKIGLCPAAENVCGTYEKEFENGEVEEISEWFSDGCKAVEAGAIISSDTRACGENTLNDPYGMLFDVGFGNDFVEPEEPEENPPQKSRPRKKETLKPVATKQVGSNRKNKGKNSAIWKNISQWGFYGRKKRSTQN